MYKDQPLKIACTFIVAIVGLFMMFRPLLFSNAPQMWADNFDGHLLYWIFAWGHQALTESVSLENFWNANALFPMKYSLAISDSLLTSQLLYSPLRWFGFSALSSMYLTLSLTVLIGVLITGLGLRRIAPHLRSFELTIILIAAHFSLCVTTFMGHFQLFAFHLAPGFFLFLIAYIRDFKIADLLTVCGLFVLGGCYATYLLPMLLAVSILFILISGVKFHRQGILVAKLKFFKSPRSVSHYLVVLTFAIFLYLIQVRYYLAVPAEYSQGGWGTSSHFAARWHSLWTGRSIHSLWYAPSGYASGDWERVYFPGYILLGGLFFIMCLKPLFAKNSALSESPSRDGFLSFSMIVIFIIAWFLSLGPRFDSPRFDLPFRHVATIIPGLAEVRAPGRFGIFFGLPLGWFVVQTFRYLTFKINSTSLLRIIGFCLALAIFFESWTNFRTYPFDFPRQPVYEAIKSRMKIGEPLLELPFTSENSYQTTKNIMAQLKGSTFHWGKLAVGYGAKTTPEFTQLSRLDRRLQEGTLRFSQYIEYASDLGFKYLLIHKSDLSETLQLEINDYLTEKKLDSEFINGSLFVYLNQLLTIGRRPK